MKYLIITIKKAGIIYYYHNGKTAYKNRIHFTQSKRFNFPEILDQMLSVLEIHFPDFTIDQIIIHSLFGGKIFTDFEPVNHQTVSKLKKLIYQSPIITNLTIELVKACINRFPKQEIMICFDTSFFKNLPVYEAQYAIDNNQSRELQIFRYGYCGLYHQAAVESLNGQSNQLNIISICLNQNPEIAGIKNMKPVFVTSGATPLEGLPGEKKCGGLDPGLVIHLSQELKWGPEKINDLLVKKSGLIGLTGQKTSFIDLYEQTDEHLILARMIFEYKLLLECGSAAAVMNGLDAVVFSGEYHELGAKISRKLKGNQLFKNKTIRYLTMSKTIEEIIMNRLKILPYLERI